MLNNAVALTFDIEDYRRQETRDLVVETALANPAEVSSQLATILDLLQSLDVNATMFVVGRLAEELPAQFWRRLVDEGHLLGCHGYEHARVDGLGAERFRTDLLRGKEALEQIAGCAVSSYRAPYFSAEGCAPWFGEELASAGFTVDSSIRCSYETSPLGGFCDLEGSSGAVLCAPLPKVRLFGKSLTVIGGTTFRLAPLSMIIRSLDLAHEKGFVPTIYLHPYDLDPAADRLGLSAFALADRAGEEARRFGRSGVADKLIALANHYDLMPLEQLIEHRKVASLS
jgi:peptidoglycan/xylan/chitin deacetylase (PgdA/CDA1 family)